MPSYCGHQSMECHFYQFQYTGIYISTNRLQMIKIHQDIRTIEYILSTISHRASCLHLWALSLAHSQLSFVLWGMLLTKILKIPAGYVSSIAIFVVFALWAFFTISIMVDCVEFMSKFYAGTASPFTPFSFHDLLKATEYDE
ncbi:V-type proton ATPase 116 kDa subunit a-like [Drosophila obscura]|uniref:V-type proton ATPase 116 kDa subunit a-like n=1 Tax=Drosophila obscura TaxID=7282 RepID=UPI001BB14FE6|nr:V-type proton ATPase 116 kDa subunit a-like [Drosophila obscura]